VVLAEQAEAVRRGEDPLTDDGGADAAANLKLEGVGFLSRVFKGVFKAVDRPWKMLPLGMLFGLGFDTSSEIAVLGIASIHGAQGTSLWLILIFPILFTGEFDPSSWWRDVRDSY